MLNGISTYPTILVTGPQRSGTTFAAKIIAEKFRYQFVDESDFGVDDRERFELLIRSKYFIVVQCPAMMRWMHCYAGYPYIFVIVMKRSISDIVKSEKRIGWKYAQYEKEKYKDTALTPEFINVNPISFTKYDYWEKFQKKYFRFEGNINCRELKYEELSTHPKWVPAELRVNWKPKQTE